MGETIINGYKGASYGARVDEFGRLHTASVVEPEDKTLARDGRTWSLYFTQTPAGANDYFFYLKNTGNAILTITDIRVMCSSSETLNYNFISGVPVYTGAVSIDPISRLFGSNKLPGAIINTDTDITGLTTEGTIFFERCATANTRYKLSTSSNIIIPQGQAFGIEAVTGTNLITCVVSLTELLTDF